MQDITAPRLTKLEGLFRIEDLLLPHPMWQFVTVDHVIDHKLRPHWRSRISDLSKLNVSPQHRWTVRTCLVEGRPSDEYGLKRSVGIFSDKVVPTLMEFHRFYETSPWHPVFVVYPYFDANKSGMVELHSQESLIEAVEGSQWRLTEEGAPSESWIYRGERSRIAPQFFTQRLDYGRAILTPLELEQLVASVGKVPDNEVLLEWTFTPGETLLFYDMRSVAAIHPPNTIRDNGPADLVGNPASPGRVTGAVRIAPADLTSFRLNPKEILVVKSITKSLSNKIPELPRITGIISETGGITSHPAIVAREFGVPMIVGMREASLRLQEDQMITMDGSTGRVYFAERGS